jgi:alpha-1,2-mannosyltransferase
MTGQTGSQRRQPMVAIACTVLAAAVLAISLIAYARLTQRFPKDYWVLEDLDVYRLGAKVALHDGPLYTDKFRANKLPFLYPPFAALLFAIVAGLKFTTLKLAMTVANICALAITVWLAFGLAGTRDRYWRLAGTLLITALTLWFDPVSQTLSFGQVNLLLMMLVVADLSLADRRLIKGAGTGIAAGIKITPLIFSAHLLVTRRFRAFAVSIGTLVATVLIGFLVVPHESVKYWLKGTFYSAGHLGSNYGGNQSLYGMIQRLTHNGHHMQIYWMTAALIVAVGGLTLSVWAHRRGDKLLAVCVSAVTGLLISPISWNHHWVWAVPVLVWTFARLPRSLPTRWRPLGWLAAAATFVVFVALPKHSPIPTPIAPAHASAGTTDTLAHISGWIWLMPVYGNDGYYWSGTQIIVGNLYVVFGLIFLLVAWGYLAATRPRTAPAASEEPAVTDAPPVTNTVS